MLHPDPLTRHCGVQGDGMDGEIVHVGVLLDHPKIKKKKISDHAVVRLWVSWFLEKSSKFKMQ